MFRASLKGLKGMQQQFASGSKNLKQICQDELDSASADFVDGARRDAPSDQRALIGAITWNPVAPLQNAINAQKFYAPFMEFGTKGKYQPIPGTEAIAAAFKGYKGGDFMDLLRMIVRWVARKGISGRYSVKTRKRVGNKIDRLAEDYSAAWLIAMSILKNGVTPHPFFFKQQETVWPEMIRRIESKLKSEMKVSVILPGDIRRPKIVTV